LLQRRDVFPVRLFCLAVPLWITFFGHDTPSWSFRPLPRPC
jgi:hypothetical protein